MDMITVKSNVENRIALWQKHPDHPGGEVFVAGGIVATVALTDEVQTRIANGFLVVTDEIPPAPWDGYDEMGVDAIAERAIGMGDIELIVVKQYEALNKNRKGVMRLGA